SSTAYFFSKPSSRLSKVVMVPAPILQKERGRPRCGSPFAGLDKDKRRVAQRAFKPQAKRQNRPRSRPGELGRNRPARLCWIGESVRLPSGSVPVLFPSVGSGSRAFTAAPSWVFVLVIRSTPNRWISTKHGTSQ